ncbi:MAG: hypothetical protein AAFX45_09555 [Pseudomonadota bacterium]
MSDVLDIARTKREQLKAEMTALDAFIRMGEKIEKSAQPPKKARGAAQGMADRLDALRVTAAE